MIWTEISGEFYGENFSPANAEKRTGLSFMEKNEVGEIGKSGRFKNKPMPYGSATLMPPLQITSDNADYGIEWLTDTIAKLYADFEATGVTSITLSAKVFHDGQCNLEFSSQLLKKLGSARIQLTISCVEDPDYVTKSIAEARLMLQSR